MKNPTLFSLLFLISIALTFCKSESQSTTSNKTSAIVSEKLSVPEFAQKLKDTPNAQLVDVRTYSEYEQGHLDNALNIDFYDKTHLQSFEKLDKNRPVFLYCKSGGRSGKCAKELKKAGFTTIYDMKGGYTAWSE